jgi:sialate O-acetylesterase
LDIHQFTGQPVGLIGTYWGGTSAEAWTSLEGLNKNDVLRHIGLRHQVMAAGYDLTLKAYPDELAAWEARDAEWKAIGKTFNDAVQQQWRLAVAKAQADGVDLPKQPDTVSEPSKPDVNGGPNEPTTLFNGMIAPLIPYAIKGVIWYQGEANAGRGLEYGTLLPAMIDDWRAYWDEGSFPFLFVQLPNFQDKWGLVREAQAKTLSVPNTGMAITMDLGTMKNIHPPYKAPVGDRLALAAEHVAYGKDVVYSGPVYRSISLDGGVARIRFDHADGGLVIGTTLLHGADIVPAPTDHLRAFFVAGNDHLWYPADAKIDGDSVLASSPQVPHPIAVRYGWDPTTECNLYNKSALPASPFRPDAWPEP